VFDGPGQRLVVRKDVPNGIHGEAAGVTMGGNPVAAAAALASMRAFLRERFALPAVAATDQLTRATQPGSQERTNGIGTH
jgi:4-aminobutyrate aminotransferase-like enzyme